MPARSVTWITISPLRASSGVPSTSMRTTSLLMPRPSPRSRRGPRDAREAHAMRHVILELVAEVAQEALHGPGGSIAERADRVPFDPVGDVDQHVELLLAALTALDAADHAMHPARPLTAGRALAAR